MAIFVISKIFYRQFLEKISSCYFVLTVDTSGSNQNTLTQPIARFD